MQSKEEEAEGKTTSTIHFHDQNFNNDYIIWNGIGVIRSSSSFFIFLFLISLSLFPFDSGASMKKKTKCILLVASGRRVLKI